MKNKAVTSATLAPSIIRYALCILHCVLILLLAGCDELGAGTEDFSQLDDILTNGKALKGEAIAVKDISFSPDYKTFVVTTQMKGDIGPYSLTDTSSVHIDVEETSGGFLVNRHFQPRLIANRNLKGEAVTRSGIKVLLLVNSTLPQPALDRIRDYTGELSSTLVHDNLYVAFMDGAGVSESMLVTDYVLSNYFERSQNSFVYLYRSILQKQQEMTSHSGVWGDAKKMALLIFSDELLYDDKTDEPLDPSHYQLEEQMIQTDSIPRQDFIVCFASMDDSRNKPQAEDHDDNVLRLFCQSHNGLFMDRYLGATFKDHMLHAFNVSQDANAFTFENPDGKVYRGERQRLTVNVRDARTDSLVTSFSTTIQEGSIYNPIIIGSRNIGFVILQGITIASGLILVVWLLFQFVIPYIRYRHFLHRHVIRYRGGNMGVGQNMVAQACYLCKQAFETDDEIVVKCEHTMHKSCWDENDYHCPEYSDRCKHGSHYYNSSNLLDHLNASFYMKWIIMAVVAALLAWILFTLKVHYIGISAKILLAIHGVSEQSPEAQTLMREHVITHMPYFGLLMGLFLTLSIGILSVNFRNVNYNIPGILLRSVAAAAGCFTAFLVVNVICVILDIEKYSFIVDWIPWAISGGLIAYCGTLGTRIRLTRLLILLSVIIGFLSMYLWGLFFFSTVIDFRVMLLLSFIIFAVGIAVSIAASSSRSERYFLKVQGAVKEMDVALFKWFRNQTDRIVTIGKSVDCSLQLSWDINGTVAPLHAQIKLIRNIPYLTALEDGVIVDGQPLAIDQPVRLFHGKSFAIGNTTFTYIEKDL